MACCAGSICTTEGPHGIIVIQPSQQAERQRPEETAVGYHKIDGSATSSKLTTRPVTALRSKVQYKPVGWSSIAEVLDGDVQVLEVEVALANGTLAVVDYQSNPHLFRALQVQFLSSLTPTPALLYFTTSLGTLFLSFKCQCQCTSAAPQIWPWPLMDSV